MRRKIAPTLLYVLSLALAQVFCALGQTNQLVYSDTLQNGWQNWSWAANNLVNTSPVHSGADSISVTCSNYTALYLHHSAFDSTPYASLTFWLNGGSAGGQVLTVESTLNGANQSTTYQLPALAKNTWQQFTVPLSAIGAANQPNVDGFWLFNNANAALPVFYADDISLVGGTNSVTQTTNAANTAVINAAANRHAISPMIYGTAFAGAQLKDLNFTMNRSGGNEETTYNWEINAHGKGADYYFESYPDSSATPAQSADSVVSESHANGAEPLITIPFIGWSPKLGANRAILPSYAVSKYGPQTGVDPYLPNAGNGISSTNSKPITWNDPNDANLPVDVNYQQGYVQHLLSTWGASTNGGVRFYCLDNEHSIWYSTHQDIHPVGPTMQEIRGKMIQYAAMIKSNDPGALILGPEEWGWNGYLYSGYDQQWAAAHGNYNPAQYPDRTTNGGWDYCPWLLNQIYQHDTNTHQRSLDFLSLHFYPQGSGEYGDDVSSATQLLRNHSTRQLWDSNYVSESWINSVVDLIPRMKNWVATNYPGTKTAITEYSWGAEGFINGATAQADVLGIFGREGLDLATRWTIPASNSLTYLAMKIYRNYDGKNSTFGDTSVSATGPNPDNVAVFAAQRSSDNALTVMAVSKYLTGVTPLTISLSNFTASGTAQVWQISSTNTAGIGRLADLTVTNGAIQTVVPGQSVTLFVLPAAVASTAPLTFQPGAPRTDGQFEFWLNGAAGQKFALQSSTNLSVWNAVSTNTFTNAQIHFLLPVGATAQFYRAVNVQ
jgi:hypothetical protein